MVECLLSCNLHQVLSLVLWTSVNLTNSSLSGHNQLQFYQEVEVKYYMRHIMIAFASDHTPNSILYNLS